MSNFGDFVNADAIDTEPADPEQVARRLQRLRVEAGLDGDRWDDLAPSEKLVIIEVIRDLLDWLRREGAT